MAETGYLAYPLPWQQQLWQRLWQQHHEQRLPHALLLKGPKGSGKLSLATAVAQFLLCEKSAQPQQSMPCGQCKACQLNLSGTHPDLKWLQPESPGKAIRVDAVRELVDFVGKTAQFSGYRVVILCPAEAMNVAASNALLKSLEEPGSDTVFLLVSHLSSSLMPTIRSRCQSLAVPVPKRDDSLQWLHQVLPDASQAEALLSAAAGQPLLALELAGSEWLETREQVARQLLALKQGRADAIDLGEKWKNLDVPMVLDWWLTWVADLAKIAGGAGTQHSQNRDQISLLQQTANLFAAPELLALHQQLQQSRRLLTSGANPNVQMLLESLLLTWSGQAVLSS